MNWTVLDPSLIGPPFLAGLLILATHVPLGRQVLARGIVFLDLAVAQIAALGVVAAHFSGLESGWPVQVFAVLAAMGGALILHLAERRWPETQEALIGSVFVVAASAGLLLLAHDPHGGESLHDLLAGQILWVSNPQLMVAAVVTVILGVLLMIGMAHVGLGFYLLFACAVTLSVQLAGIYLVFASLIIPALTVRRVRGRHGLSVAWGIGAAGYGLGLVLSAQFDVPSGAMIVCALAAVALLFALIAGKRLSG
jgi:zinc/manganese transport system permease protein